MNRSELALAFAFACFGSPPKKKFDETGGNLNFFL